MKLVVDFNASYDRVPHPDAKLEDSINEVLFLGSFLLNLFFSVFILLETLI